MNKTMDENITPRLDGPGSPRTADDIVFDLALVKDSDNIVDQDDDFALSELDSNQVQTSDLDINFESVDNKAAEINLFEAEPDEDKTCNEFETNNNDDNTPDIDLFEADVIINDDVDNNPDTYKEAVKDEDDLTKQFVSESLPKTLLTNNSDIESQNDRLVEANLNPNFPNGDHSNDVNSIDPEKKTDYVGKNYDKEGDYNKQSIEFSGVLAMAHDDMSNGDGFMAIVTNSLHDQGEVDTELEIEGEADINLDNITIQEKQEESDSGSEFDFELPAVAAKKPDVVKDKTDPAVNASRDNNQKEDENVPNAAPTVVQAEPSTCITEDNVKKGEFHLPTQSAMTKDQNVAVHVSSYPGQPDITTIQSTEQEKQPVTVHNGSQRVLEAAQNEWDNVTTIQAGFVEGNTKGTEPTVVATLTPMSPYELTQILKKEDFSGVKSNIKVFIERKGLAAFVNFLFGPPKLKRHLVEEKERIFCIAASQLSNDNPSHLRTLQTIYRSLTGSKFDNARYGSHWEEIGFQGTDPGTDLRSVGFLGLVNLLFLLKTPRTQTLASDIYRLSLHPTQNFPFCVMGINITRITIQVLREDLLNKECNRRGEVLEAVCEFYVGLYLMLYQVWKGQNKTITDSGFVIKDIEMKARKSTSEVFKNLEDYLTKKKTIVTDISPGKEPENLNFVNVCEDS